MAYSQREGDLPYHSIDLEASPSTLHDPPEKEERMPLSPRASPAPQLQIQQASGGPQGVYPPRPGYEQTPSQSSSAHHKLHKSTGSWDVLGGIAKDWNEFDSRNGSKAAFQYAEGLSLPFTTRASARIYFHSCHLFIGDAPQTKARLPRPIVRGPHN